MGVIVWWFFHASSATWTRLVICLDMISLLVSLAGLDWAGLLWVHRVLVLYL